MKKTAILLLILLFLAAGTVGWGLMHTDLQVIGKSVRVLPARERTEEFSALREAVKNQSLLGTQLTSGDMGEASDYSFFIYTLRLKNSGLVDAEMVEVQIAPLVGDALFYTDPGEKIIKAGETGDVQCVLLTRGKPHPVRDLYVTYYLWGHPQEVKYTYESKD